MESSPYALVVGKSGSYDETAGVPCYLYSDGNKVFVGFTAYGKYIVPEGVIVSVMWNNKKIGRTEQAEKYIKRIKSLKRNITRFTWNLVIKCQLMIIILDMT